MGKNGWCGSSLPNGWGIGFSVAIRVAGERNDWYNNCGGEVWPGVPIGVVGLPWVDVHLGRLFINTVTRGVGSGQIKRQEKVVEWG